MKKKNAPSVINRIAEAYAKYVDKNIKPPNTIYINKKDFIELFVLRPEIFFKNKLMGLYINIAPGDSYLRIVRSKKK